MNTLFHSTGYRTSDHHGRQIVWSYRQSDEPGTIQLCLSPYLLGFLFEPRRSGRRDRLWQCEMVGVEFGMDTLFAHVDGVILSSKELPFFEPTLDDFKALIEFMVSTHWPDQWRNPPVYAEDDHDVSVADITASCVMRNAKYAIEAGEIDCCRSVLRELLWEKAAEGRVKEWLDGRFGRGKG